MNVTITDAGGGYFTEGNSSDSCYSEQPQEDEVDYFGVDAETATLIRQVLGLSEEAEITIKSQREFDCCGDIREVYVSVESSSQLLREIAMSPWYRERDRVAIAVSDWLEYEMKQREHAAG